MVLVKGGKAVADCWTHLGDDDALPAAGPVTLSWKRWLAERGGLTRDPSALGVRVPNDLAPTEIGADAARFGLVAVAFPSFTDGRAF